MNASQIHLALTHVPVILSLVGMVALVISFTRVNPALRKTALYILVIAGIAALPVFFTGEGAEETIEHLPGISESLIEKHESIAKFSLVAILASAVLALVSLPDFIGTRFRKGSTVALLFVSFIAAGLMIQTAHLGGQIRHSEITTAGSFPPESMEKEHDD